jgi:signal transduction histidine kinase
MNPTRKVLIIDDEEDHIILIARILENAGGYNIQSASTLDQTFALLKKIKPDIILADFKLPDGDARSVITEYAQNIPVIVMTSFGNEQLAVEMIKAGALDYLVKTPENFNNICWYIERSLREWQTLCERKKAEKALQKSNEQLSKVNKELMNTIEELKISREKAIESDRLKSAFLANMSHEIRTPMNGILGFANLLSDKDISEEEKASYLEIINNCANQLLVILDDLIDLAKIEANQLAIHKREVNINELMNELFVLFSPKIAEGIKFKYVPVSDTNGDIIVLTDHVRLKQILSNLINNAIKFTKQGSIQYGYSIKENELEFYVKDTGLGISPEKQKIIFQRFVQAEASENRTFGGTGLGLTISKALVEMLGGTIWVESTPGKGSCFYFTIPGIKASKYIKKNINYKENDTEFAESDKVILLVEDDEMNNRYIETILNIADVKLLRAVNVTKAIEYINKSPHIKAILMNMKVSFADTFNAIRSLKQLRPDIPVIIQSGFLTTDDKARALQAGCDYYISKPVMKEELLSILRSLFQKSQ